MRRFLTASLLFLAGCSSASSADRDEVKVKEAGTDVDAALDAGGEDSAAIDSGVSYLADGSFDLVPPGSGSISYWGGPVLSQPINVYLIWYGGWQQTDPGAVPIIEDLVSNLSSSAWWSITSQYFQQPTVVNADAGLYIDELPLDAGPDVLDPVISSKAYVSGTVFAGSSIDLYSRGTYLEDSDLPLIVENAINGGSFPLDPSGVYLVLTSVDVIESSGFCDNYCAFHFDQVVLGKDVKIAFIGDTEQCPDECSVKAVYKQFGFTSSPNGDWAADEMATTLAHELSESANDPEVYAPDFAWLSDLGSETDDLCAWSFRQPFITPNNSVANMMVGDRYYLIQQNFVLDNAETGAGHCALSPTQL